MVMNEWMEFETNGRTDGHSRRLSVGLSRVAATLTWRDGGDSGRRCQGRNHAV